MVFLRSQVTKSPEGAYEVRIWARDDAGHILTTVVQTNDRKSIHSVVHDSAKSLQVLAANYTEEEGFQEKTKK